MRWILLLLTAGCSSLNSDKSDSSDWSYETDSSDTSTVPNEESTWLSGFQTINEENSSSTIQVRWNRPQNVNVIQFRLSYIDQSTNEEGEIWIEAGVDTASIPNLKSDTEYLIELAACLDSNCSTKIASDYDQMFSKTAIEQWSIQGDGESFAELSPLISGEHLQSYAYDSSSGTELYVFSEVEQRIWKRSLQSFGNVSLESTSVDQHLLDCAPESCGHIEIETIQVVQSENGSDQLLVLAQNNGSSPEIYIVTPQNSDTSSVCQLEVDCSLSPFFHSSDILLSDFHLHRSEEHSFLILEGHSTCSDRSGFYLALLNNDSWEVTTDVSGCPRTFADGASVPSVHVDGNHFNLYFTLENRLRTLYGPSSSEPTISSWETMDLSRGIELNWPNGSALSPEEEQQLLQPSVLFGDSEHLFFSLSNSETNGYGIYVATLTNP